MKAKNKKYFKKGIGFAVFLFVALLIQALWLSEEELNTQTITTAILISVAGALAGGTAYGFVTKWLEQTDYFKTNKD